MKRAEDVDAIIPEVVEEEEDSVDMAERRGPTGERGATGVGEAWRGATQRGGGGAWHNAMWTERDAVWRAARVRRKNCGEILEGRRRKPVSDTM